MNLESHQLFYHPGNVTGGRVVASADQERMADGISKDRLAQFQRKHPESKHPLIDYLAEKPGEKASFQNLKDSYPAINNLFADDSFWQTKNKKRYLSLIDIANIFDTADGSTKKLDTRGRFRQLVRMYFVRWHKESDKKYKSQYFDKYADHKFYEEKAVEGFLLFMLDVLSGRKINDTKKAKPIVFSKENMFKSVVKKKNRLDIVIHSSSKKASPEEKKEKLELFIETREIRLLGTVKHDDDLTSINNVYDEVIPKVGRTKFPIEIVIGRESKSGDAVSAGAILDIDNRKIEVVNRFRVVREHGSVVVVLPNEEKNVHLWVRRAHMKQLNAYFIEEIIHREAKKKHEKKREKEVKKEQVVFDRNLEYPILRRGKQPTISRDSFEYRGIPLKMTMSRDRQSLYKLLKMREKEINVLEAFLKSDAEFPTFVKIAEDSNVSIGSLQYYIKNIRKRLSGEE